MNTKTDDEYFFRCLTGYNERYDIDNLLFISELKGFLRFEQQWTYNLSRLYKDYILNGK